MIPPDALAWDASALMAACRAERLDVLSDIASGYRSVTTTAVLSELEAHDVADVVTALRWPEVVRLEHDAELDALLRWTQAVGSQGRHNFGEATVLAWAQVHDAVAIMDDSEARRVARKEQLEVHGTLWLFAEAIRSGRESESSLTGTVEALIKDGRARYPFARGHEFGEWARAAGLLAPPTPSDGGARYPAVR